MGDTVIGLSTGGGGSGSGGMIAIVALAIVAFMFIWIWRQREQTPTAGASLNTPFAPILGQPNVLQPNVPNQIPPTVLPGGTPTCPTGYLYSSAEDTCVLTVGAQTPAEELPDPNPAICSSQFNGSCNTECGANGDPDECAECNAVCDTEIAYTGPEEEEPATAGGATTGATCPAGYTLNAAGTLCVLTTAAPVYPTTPISPPLTTGQRTAECSSRYNGSCNTECSGGSSAQCNACMVACGQATTGTSGGGGTSGGRTAECSSRYNGSCNTECSSGGGSTCNACRAACGLAANIATVRSAASARKLLNNRLYNALKAKAYNPREEIRFGYQLGKMSTIKIGNLT